MIILIDYFVLFFFCHYLGPIFSTVRSEQLMKIYGMYRFSCEKSILK